jgi:hypothetical protein
LEIVLFNTLLRRSLEAVGFAYVVWSSSSAEISSLTACENEVKMSLLVTLSGSFAGHENEVSTSSSAEVSDSPAEVQYVSVASEV